MSRRIPVRDAKNPHAPYYAIVDDEDFEWLSRFTWHAIVHTTKTVYAGTNVKTEERLPSGRAVFRGRRMHKMITGYDQTDHVNRIGLDNRRENLRPANVSQNCANQAPRAGVSRLKGVSQQKEHSGWISQIGYQNEHFYLGSFETEKEAAKSYDTKAREVFGEFACLNFPDEVVSAEVIQEYRVRYIEQQREKRRPKSCPQGHPYDEDNTYVRPDSGARKCRICLRNQWNEWYRRRKERNKEVPVMFSEVQIEAAARMLHRFIGYHWGDFPWEDLSEQRQNELKEAANRMLESTR